MVKKITFILMVISLLMGVTALPASHAQDDDLTDITLFVSFIPSVQFAPVYAAIEQGYFEAEGLNVTVEHSFNEADGVDRIAIGDLQFGVISGEQVIIGRGVEKPLVYVYEWFHDFPVGIVAPADAGITTPADLEGKKVGIPGPFGASFMGFRALLASSDIDELALQIETIGFTAPESVCQGTVDAAVVYVSNEPLTIQENCFDVSVIQISDYVDLVANGLVTNEDTIENDPDLVAGMVRALQQGVIYTIENPDDAFDLSVENFVLDLPEAEYETQRIVLDNSIALWESDALGQTDPARWENTQTALIDSGLMENPLDDLAAAYTNEFVPLLDE